MQPGRASANIETVNRYDAAIDGAPGFTDPPELEVVRMVEQDDVVMAESETGMMSGR